MLVQILMNICSQSDTWTIVASLGSLIGGGASLLAVLITLYQIRKQTIKSLHLSMGFSKHFGTSSNRPCVYLSVMNRSNREIRLVTFGCLIGKTWFPIACAPTYGIRGSNVFASPHLLFPEDQIAIGIDLDALNKNVENAIKAGESFRSKIKFVIIESGGKVYKKMIGSIEQYQKLYNKK